MEDEENANFQLKCGVTLRPWDYQSAYYEYDSSKANAVDIEAFIMADECNRDVSTFYHLKNNFHNLLDGAYGRLIIFRDIRPMKTPHLLELICFG